MAMGFCPTCGRAEKSRERRPNGDSKCAKGHTFPSKALLDEPLKTFSALNHVPDAQREYARQQGGLWVVGGHLGDNAAGILEGLHDAVEMTSKMLVSVPDLEGPLAIAVIDHAAAEQLAGMLAFMKRPNDQGVRVIPFAASALGFCGPGTRLFRGLVAIQPRYGPITPNQFTTWIERSIAPHLAPGAPRLSL